MGPTDILSHVPAPLDSLRDETPFDGVASRAAWVMAR